MRVEPRGLKAFVVFQHVDPEWNLTSVCRSTMVEVCGMESLKDEVKGSIHNSPGPGAACCRREMIGVGGWGGKECVCVCGGVSSVADL